MKKLLAIILAAIMLLSLSSCALGPAISPGPGDDSSPSQTNAG